MPHQLLDVYVALQPTIPHHILLLLPDGNNTVAKELKPIHENIVPIK